METLDSAASSSPLSLIDANPTFFTLASSPTMPATVELSGSSNLELSLFDVVATGTTKAATPGTIVLTMYGISKADASGDIANWLPLGSTVAEPIGGATDLPETMWWVRCKDCMVFTGSGKMIGQFSSNVAGTPALPVDLEHHPDDITKGDPLYLFAVGAAFTPDVDPGDGSELCSLKLHSLVLGA